jgi:hypothetical protein
MIMALKKVHELEAAKVLEECDKRRRTFVSMCAAGSLTAQEIINQANKISGQLKEHTEKDDLRSMVKGVKELQNDIMREIDSQVKD